MNATASEFWHEHRGLVWSNPSADDSTHIRAAILRPRFSLLLDIAVEFGLERVRQEWLELQKDDTREVRRAHEPVERFCPTLRKDLPVLPPETEMVWNFLKEQPALNGFVLVGGSASSMTICHRLSEDLDFIYPANRLPRLQLTALLASAGESEFDFQRNDNEAAVQEFLHDGLELHNYQHDFLVNGAVKASFSRPMNQ